MSGFAVQPPALRQMADMLERAAMHSGAARNHLFPIAQLTATEGDFDTAGHAVVIGSIQDWFYDLGMLCADSGSRVRAAADYYQSTDREQARTYDETEFPDDVYVTDAREGSGYVPIEPPEGTATFGDVVDPLERGISTVIDKGDYEEVDMAHMSWWESLSISSVMNETFVQASTLLATLGLVDRPYSPLEEIFRPWVGD